MIRLGLPQDCLIRKLVTWEDDGWRSLGIDTEGMLAPRRALLDEQLHRDDR